jgi:hypothetical protein
MRFTTYGFAASPTQRCYTWAMTADNENVTRTRAVRPSTLRVRRHRERRRGQLRLLTVEIPESLIEDAIA